MLAATVRLNNTTKETFLQFIGRSFLSLSLSLALFVGGIILLTSRISGWNLFLGIPSTQIGIVFSIFTFEKIARGKVSPASFHMIRCSACEKLTQVPTWQKEVICQKCQQKMAKKLKMSKEGN